MATQSVTVMGAGVTGVTTAWYLANAGFDVTVIDRQAAPALETSFANGGQISVCHATPWANPSTPFKVLKWLGKKDAPLLYRMNANLEQLAFIARFLGQCTPKKADDNLVQMVNLGLYSRREFLKLLSRLPLAFEQRHQGIMHFYTSQSEYDAAIAPTKRMRELGCDRVSLDPSNACQIEPALSVLGDALVGATYTDKDFSGNAHLFTAKLANACQTLGVKFIYNTNITKIIKKNNHIDHITLSQDNTTINHHADHFVVCLASYGKRLLDPIGVRLPIFPAKGYSATYAVTDPAHIPSVSLIDDEYKLVMSRFTSSAGDHLRVAGTAEFNGYSLALDAARCHAITARVRRLFGDALDYTNPHYWTGLRPMTPSNVPLIGKAHLGNVTHGSHGTAIDNLWLNTGHGTLGFTHSCGSAHALSLLMTNQATTLDFAFVGIA